MVKPLRVIGYSTASGWIAQFIGIVESLITLPIIIFHFGKTQYGVWILVGEAIHFFRVTDLGVTNTVGRFIAQFRGQQDREAINTLLTSVIGLFVFVGLVISIIVLLISPWISNLLNIKAEFAKEATLVFIITGMSFAALFPIRIGQGIIVGYQRYEISNIFRIIGPTFKLIAVLVLAHMNALGIVELAIVSALSMIFAQLIKIIVAWKIVGPISININNFSFPMLKDVISLGLSAFMITISTLIYRQGMVIAVGIFLGTIDAGIYGVALSLMTHISSLLTQTTRPMMTLASEIQASDKMKQLRQTSNQVMKISFALGVSILAGLFFYGEPFLKLFLFKSEWTAHDVHQAEIALIIMSLGFAIGIPQMAARSTLQGIGKHWPVARRFFVASIVSLVTGIILMSLGFGILGAAFGWSLIYILQGVLLYPALICHSLEHSVKKMLSQSYVPGGIVGLLMFLIVWLLSTLLPPLGLFAFLFGVTISIITGCFLLIMLLGKRFRTFCFGFLKLKM